MAKLQIEQADDHLDLVPLIDCIFLLLLFFMLCGRMSSDTRTEQISVPPTKTAVKFEAKGWQREVINVFGTTQAGDPPRNSLRLGAKTFASKGINDYTGYQQLRAILDADAKSTQASTAINAIRSNLDSIQSKAVETSALIAQNQQSCLTATAEITALLSSSSTDRKAVADIVEHLNESRALSKEYEICLLYTSDAADE